MQTAESLERIAFELAEDNLAEGVRYIEVRFAPQLHINDRLDVQEVVTAVCRGLGRAQKRHNLSKAVRTGADVPFHFGIIVLRVAVHRPGQMSPYYRRLFDVMPYASSTQVCAAASMELARAAVDLAHNKGLPVVGFDLAGAEARLSRRRPQRRLPVRRTPISSAKPSTPAKPTAPSPSSRRSRNATPTASATAPGSSRTI